MNQYVALLRGINVGGKNLIKMADLRACFEGLGFSNVRTYIQSGNVLFYAARLDQSIMAEQIEMALSSVFDYYSWVVLRTESEMNDIVTQAPRDFGSDPDTYRYDVIFLKEPLTSAEAIPSVPLMEGVDQAFAGDGVLYFSRLISQATKSHLSRIIGTPVYQSMTIRNWNTTTRLLNMMDAQDY
jgi:uncharacterized protein (DUF1697 family)